MLSHPLTYERTQRRVVEHLLAGREGLAGLYEHRSVPSLTIAHDPKDAEHVYGWACTERRATGPLIIHYVHVKHEFRRLGVATALLAPVLAERRTVLVSHATDKALSVMRENPALRETLGCAYSPFLRYNPMLAVWPDTEVAL